MRTHLRTPRYIQIATYLRLLIQQDKLKNGTQLPTELELCKRFQCSRSTVRQALEMLVRDGDVKRVRGAGTFIAEKIVVSRSTLLAVIVPNVYNSEFARFVQVLGMAARDTGHTLLLTVTNDVAEIEQAFIDEVAKLKIAGVIKFPTNIELEEETRNRFREYGLPYVIVNDFWTDSRRDYHVSYDEVAAVEMAVNHLVELGHKRIAWLDGTPWPRSKAMDAFFKCLARRKLPHGEGHVLLFDIGEKPPPVEQLYMNGALHPTAVVTPYDVGAGQLLQQLRKFEMRVPEDVSIVSLNGKPVELPLDIDLTTAVPPNRKMIDQVLKTLAAGPQEGQVRHYMFQPGFHVGESSAPCRETTQALERERAGAAPALKGL